MRSISDTIARLSAFKAHGLPGVQGLPGADAPGQDRLSDLAAFGANPGALRARTYIPEGLVAGAPLVVVLHGCTQTAAGYDHHSGWSRLADEAGFALLFPEQQRGNNPNLCFNWFKPGDVARGTGEALSIRNMIEALVTRDRLDRRRIYVTGLSAGGAMTVAMLASYPEVFAGGAPIAGLAFASAASVPEAFDRMRGHGAPPPEAARRRLAKAASHIGPWPTLSVWQGTADATVAPSNADAIVAQWRGVHDVADAPTVTRPAPGHTRSVWADAQGRAMIELNVIAGMGHGTPLAARGPDGLGTAGPFMLEVGVSSTRQIAAGWGIATAEARKAEAARKTAPQTSAEPPKAAAPTPAAPSAGKNSPANTKPASTSPADTRSAKANPAKPEPEEAPSRRRSGYAGPIPGTGTSGGWHVTSGVRRTIENALRSAGLMR